MSNQIKATDSIIQHGIDNLSNGYEGKEVADLHNYLYNEDYFIIGYARADEFLAEYGTMDAIREVQQYEQDNFGAVNTDLGDSEKVVNMLTYIVGEEVLNKCATVSKNWDKKLTKTMIAKIEKELKAQLFFK